MVSAYRFLVTSGSRFVLACLISGSLLGGPLLGASLIGCSAGDGEEDPGTDPETGASVFNLASTVDNRGRAAVSFDIPRGTTKIAVTAESASDGSVVRFEELRDAEGNDFLHANRQVLSLADEFLNFLNTANAPSRESDPQLDSSSRFAATAIVEGVGEGESINFTVNTKSDNNLSGGQLRVNIFYVGDVGRDSNTRAAVTPALAEFQRIYREQAGITVQISELEIDGPVQIPAPITGDRFYLSASRGAFSPAVNVFILGDVSDFAGQVLGIAGGIPGPPNPSPRSGVAVSILTSAGPDGRYSTDDIRVLGETIAHETGHYMGLFHPVDFSGEVAVDEDPLSDTTSCSNFFDCANTDIINNLMFSTPVEDGAGGLVPQNQLTRQQSGVMNRYVVTD